MEMYNIDFRRGEVTAESVAQSTPGVNGEASTDINDILSRLSPEQREQVLNHINHLKK